MGTMSLKRAPQPSLYDLLQVSPQAHPQVIQAAYRVLARSYHPDVSSDPEAVRLIRELNAAYEVLSDPARRAVYDAECARTASALRTVRTARVPQSGTRWVRAASLWDRPGVLPCLYAVVAALAALLLGVMTLLLGSLP
jgi:curved DNA-binding protein CbpA